MKNIILTSLICLLLFSCNGNKENGDSVYTAVIAWNTDLISNVYHVHTVHGDYIYFYERPPGYTTVNIYALTKLDARTGAFIWRSDEIFSNILFCQPIEIGEYVYVFLEPNFIACFKKETGEITAIVKVNINESTWIYDNVTSYQQYIYMSLRWNYFVRLNVDNIIHGDPETAQDITPEILWQTETGNSVTSKPIFYNDVVYTNTYSPLALEPVELAGFDINTKEMVFYTTFGGPEDDGLPFPENGGFMGNPILIHNDILYFLNWSIAAWDLNTGEQLYRHTFTNDIPQSQRYYATSHSLQSVYYNENIYYTSGVSYTPNSFKNIHCINASTGLLVWSTIAESSETLSTNPIIAHGKLYVSQHSGLRKYDPENGNLLDLDSTFRGVGMGRNILYNDYMICIRIDRTTNEGRLVAVYVGE
jgi:outer membrane protein assembly factor BamB